MEESCAMLSYDTQMKCFDLTQVNALRIPGGMKKAVVCCLNPSESL